MNSLRSIPQNLSSTFGTLVSRGGLVAVFILCIVALFVVKLPTWLLDLLLVSNILIALTLLLRGLFLDRTTPMFTFPAILVLTTLFRLALNVSSTKLILLQGDQGFSAAGEVIRAFGQFVVRGDFVVGIIIFAIIAVVNFVVIAKGSARVAEVSARFSLDALPGRQLSIDSELRNESITKEQAAEMRTELDRQSQFFGSMDGAMKWVQGDAVAGLVITFINAIGGISIGVFRGLPFLDAVDTFGILTIGDGLVSILPSLLISVSAGIIVTQGSGGSNNDSGGQMITQVMADPRAPAIAALAMLALGFLGVTGAADLPYIPFFVVGLLVLMVVGSRNWVVEGRAQFDESSSEGADILTAAAMLLPTPGTLLAGALPAPETTTLHPLLIEVDSQLLGPLFGFRGSGANWLDAFHKFSSELRQDVFRRRGLRLPEPRIAERRSIEPGSYRLLVRERLVRTGLLSPNLRFVVANEATVSVFGIEVLSTTNHPIDQRAAVWVRGPRSAYQALSHLGIDAYAPFEFLMLDALGAILENVEEIFGVGEVRSLLGGFQERHPTLIEEVFGAGVLSYAEFTEVLRRLVRERVNIRDLKLVLEGVAEFAALTPAPEEDRQEWISELHAFVRMVLARGIIDDALAPGDKLRTFVLSGEIEDEFRSAMSMWDYSRARPPLDPQFEATLRANATKLFNPVIERGAVPVVVLCPAEIRPAVQEFFARQLPTPDWIRTISYQELDGQHQPEPIGILGASG